MNKEIEEGLKNIFNVITVKKMKKYLSCYMKQ